MSGEGPEGGKLAVEKGVSAVPVIHFLGKVVFTKDPELGLHQEEYLPQSYIMTSGLSLPL